MDAIQKQNLKKRQRWFSETAISLPTLADVPGVVVTGRYRTKKLRLKMDARGHAIARPRQLFVAPRRQAQVIHLGSGKVLFQ